MADEVVQHYIYDISGGETSSIKDGDTTNPILYEPGDGTGPKEATVTAGDYVNWVDYYQYDDPIVPSFINRPLYVYTLNSEWKYVGQSTVWFGCSIFDCSGTDIKLDEGDGHFYEGSTCDKIVVSPYNKEGITSYYVENYDGTGGYKYYGIYPDEWNIESPTLIEHTETQTVTVNYGDRIVRGYNIDNEYTFQYPGIWVISSDYPKLDIPIPEPKYKGHVQLKWTDPPDITDWKPTPATWEGTVIVRKENSAPLHRWDGDKVVRTTTRDKYKSKPYKDEDIETNKVYYYAFMPYYTKIDDPQHPIRYYTFTKCIRVETGTISYIPEIIKIDMDEDVATITYAITLPATGPYDTAKLYGKKDGNPACDNTDDIVLDISQVDDQVVVPDIDGDYFFCIQVANGTDTFTSDVVGCSGGSAFLDYWRNVPFTGDTSSSSWTPLTLDEEWMNSDEHNWSSIPSTAITNMGTLIHTSKYYQIALSMQDGDEYKDELFNNGYYKVWIELQAMDSGSYIDVDAKLWIQNLHTLHSEHADLNSDVTNYWDDDNQSFYFGFVENSKCTDWESPTSIALALLYHVDMGYCFVDSTVDSGSLYDAFNDDRYDPIS